MQNEANKILSLNKALGKKCSLKILLKGFEILVKNNFQHLSETEVLRSFRMKENNNENFL